MAGIKLINANSSQPILSCEDQATFHGILAVMYLPPANLDLFHNQFTGMEDEPMHCLPCLVRVHAQLLTLYICF